MLLDLFVVVKLIFHPTLTCLPLLMVMTLDLIQVIIRFTHTSEYMIFGSKEIRLLGIFF